MAAESGHDLDCLCISELEKIAHERIGKQTRDYYNEGAELGLHPGRETWSRTKSTASGPRVLRDMSRIDTSRLSVLGPLELHSARRGADGDARPRASGRRRLRRRGRAGRLGVVMGLLSFATTSLEDVCVRERGKSARVAVVSVRGAGTQSEVDLAGAEGGGGMKAVFLMVDTSMLDRRESGDQETRSSCRSI